jgi:hypothetical protein
VSCFCSLDGFEGAAKDLSFLFFVVHSGRLFFRKPHLFVQATINTRISRFCHNNVNAQDTLYNSIEIQGSAITTLALENVIEGTPNASVSQRRYRPGRVEAFIRLIGKISCVIVQP